VSLAGSIALDDEVGHRAAGGVRSRRRVPAREEERLGHLTLDPGNARVGEAKSVAMKLYLVLVDTYRRAVRS